MPYANQLAVLMMAFDVPETCSTEGKFNRKTIFLNEYRHLK
jgi:hypothetical protein